MFVEIVEGFGSGYDMLGTPAPEYMVNIFPLVKGIIH
jgi:hypothetical protein